MVNGLPTLPQLGRKVSQGLAFWRLGRKSHSDYPQAHRFAPLLSGFWGVEGGKPPVLGSIFDFLHRK
jgi:hypothetical protein